MVSGQAEFLTDFIRLRKCQMRFSLFISQTRRAGLLQSLDDFDRRIGFVDGVGDGAARYPDRPIINRSDSRLA